MDNENQNQNNRKSEPEQSSSQENIPLWLQGLDNSEEEDKGGVTNKERAEGSWTKELSDTPENDTQNDEQSEKILPDWLSTLSNVESEMPKNMDDHKAEEPNAMPEKNESKKDNFDADEITEKVEIKNSLREDVSKPEDSSVEDNLSEEGFVEISEMDLTDEKQPDQLAQDENLSEADELPYWLKDMIVEQPGESYPHKAMTYAEIVALSKEDTKPIKVSDETDVSEEGIPEDELSEDERTTDLAEAGELDETIITEKPEIVAEPVEPEPKPDDIPAALVEDDTKPVRPHHETSEIKNSAVEEKDQQILVEEAPIEEAPVEEQPLDSNQIQEESEELSEIDQEQWAAKEASEHAPAVESEAPATWPEQESAIEEAEAASQWIELEPEEEEAESQASPHWPEREQAVQETELQAPDQWLEAETTEKEDEPERSDINLDQEQAEVEAEPTIEVENEYRESVEERIAAEETEEIKVKASDQEPETPREQEEFEQPVDLDQTKPEAAAETETKPELTITQMPEASPEEVLIAQEEIEQPGGTPKTLRFAKYLLDQGDFDRAKEIFKPYIENSEFLDDIEAWLIEASNNGAKNHSGTWELIGDIAMAQNHPSRAFEAYKEAITVLLSTKKETNETD